MLTLAEYLEDYGKNGIREKGYRLIEKNLKELDEEYRTRVLDRLERVKQGERDIYF
jgi:2-iminoacetate synthase